MTDRVDATWTGLQQLLDEMRGLPAQMQQRLMKGTVATGCSVIRQEAIRLAPEWTGNATSLQAVMANWARGVKVSAGHPPPGTLKRAIYQARLASECTPTLEVWIVSVRSGKAQQTVKRGKGTVNLDAFYAAWVERGHFARATKGSAGQFVPARPFMRPAFDTKKQAAFDAMRDYLYTNLPAATSAFRFLKAVA